MHFLYYFLRNSILCIIFGMFIRPVKEITEKQGVIEVLKAENQMEWVGQMDNICNQATELVNAELIYN